MNLIILIPPSQGKVSGGTNFPLKQINPITKSLISSIKKHDPKKLYGLKEKVLLQTISINNQILTSPTMRSIDRYKGVVYSAIDYPSLNNKSLFNDRIRIVSALFGLVKSLDLIPNYSLKIDKLNSASLWLNENSKQLENHFIIDLLPLAHKKAIFYKDGISVEFILIKNAKKMPAGHQGKHIKGRFVRWLIENNITNPKDFVKFNEDGYSWNGDFFIKEV